MAGIFDHPPRRLGMAESTKEKDRFLSRDAKGQQGEGTVAEFHFGSFPRLSRF